MSSPPVTTTCGYCGVGCRLEAHTRSGRIASISPALDGPANEGHTCLKGRFAHQFSRRRDRLTTPLIKRDGVFEPASWDEALALVVGEWQTREQLSMLLVPIAARIRRCIA